MVARLRRVVATAADRRGVIVPGEVVLVACSGGPDSTALLDAMHHTSVSRGWTLHVAHVDHGIREGSEQEAEQVAALAAARGLAFHPLRTSVAAGPSLQERARAARRALLGEAAAAIGASVIALGHTSDDQAETVLMSMLSTATPMSVAGMRERGSGYARPLLAAWRAETAAYCEALRLPVLTDPSNEDRRFVRSRVRHDVLPALEAAFPGARRRLVALAARQQRLFETAGAPEIP